MANPRRKISRSKRDKRRASWAQKLSGPNYTECLNCGNMKLSHRACSHCGYYKGQQVYTVKEH